METLRNNVALCLKTRVQNNEQKGENRKSNNFTNLFVALEKLEESKHAQNIECAERKTKG